MLAPLADLERTAALTPDQPALVSSTRRYTFAELKRVVDAAAIRLRAEGVTPRSLVAVDLPSLNEWIIDLALMRLAARSVSLRGVPEPSGLRADVLITEPGRRVTPAGREVVVDERWLVEAVSGASGTAPLVEYPRPDSIVRLMMTSGTTGTPRAAAYSAAALEYRTEGLHRYWSDGRAEVNFMALSTTGGFHTAIANLRHGQAHRAVDRIDADTMRFVAAEGVQVLCGSPQQMAHAIGVLDQAHIALPQVEEVRMAGATPGDALLRRIAEVLAVPVRSVYGSTEGGGVTMRMLAAGDDLANVGPALQGSELEVVDENGAPLPLGVKGTVRYRSPGQTSGYLVGATVEPFPGGWFAPGDLGVLEPDGSLVLAGRSAEILNIAGQKVDPAVVDGLAAQFPGVRDAAAFGFERSTGLAELGLAVVADADCDLRALDRDLRARLPGGYPTTFWRVSEIPRNRMGKAERGVLAEAFGRTGSVR